ncbi:universal stress protein [Azospirillum sp. SYSU D00513]|uniref:universal stress protein n=1 Tax=Azospirillum sp. SYSU D00513 TaxID=2812561 RepID=UPI001A96F9B4|nr:universal stress protein [Azospirillum sp. SYSU D00513]
MACKDILVHFDGTASGVKRVEAAARLAERHGAHLAALVLDFGAQVPVFLDGQVPAGIVAQLARAAAEETARQAAELDALLARQSCQTERRVARCRPDTIADTLALHARYADLLVLGQPPVDEMVAVSQSVVEEVLLSSGRPVLIVPYIGAGATIGDRVLVAWDGGREAARAVADAMPIIEKARSVHVLTVNADRTGNHGEEPGADIALHLARHGVPVEVASTRADTIAASDLTLNWMFEYGTDLLVMGAYGHSRVRELVLGGMTRGMLRNMTVPVLMSH